MSTQIEIFSTLYRQNAPTTLVEVKVTLFCFASLEFRKLFPCDKTLWVYDRVFVFLSEWDASCVDVHAVMNLLLHECQLVAQDCSQKGNILILYPR